MTQYNAMLWEWIVASDPHWTVFTEVSLKRGWKHEGKKNNLIHSHTGVTVQLSA